MRVSSNSTNYQAKFTTTKPLKDTSVDAKASSAKKEPRSSKFDLKGLKGADFATALKANLKPDSNNQVHEEMLQAGVVKSILQQANPEAAEIFNSSLESIMVSGMGTEDAVKSSLKNLVGEGYLNQSDADLINGISFRASQLDSNLDALYDNKGSDKDQTIAVDSLENAILKASEVIGQMQEQDVSPNSRSLDVPSNTIFQSSPASDQSTDTGIASNSSVTSATSSGKGSRSGFLWKPVSDSNGKLVVLLPTSLTGKVDSVSIYSSQPENGGTPMDKGRYTGDANGNRGHFRFSKPGSGYPDGAYVVATLKDGSQASFQIGDSSERNT